MPIRDLRDRYGEGKAAAVVNRAIRAELIAGDDILDASNLLASARRKLQQRNLPGALVVDAAHAILEGARLALVDEIAERYGLRPNPTKDEPQ